MKLHEIAVEKFMPAMHSLFLTVRYDRQSFLPITHDLDLDGKNLGLPIPGVKGKARQIVLVNVSTCFFLLEKTGHWEAG